MALRAVKRRARGRIVFTCCEFISDLLWFQLSPWCGKVLLDPSTSAILLDQSTGQQQLNVTAGILAPKAPLGPDWKRIAKAPSHHATLSKTPICKIPFFWASAHHHSPSAYGCAAGSFCIGHRHGPYVSPRCQPIFAGCPGHQISVYRLLGRFLGFCVGTRYETILEVRPKVGVLDHQASCQTCKLLLVL